jgi:hypothetical protein
MGYVLFEMTTCNVVVDVEPVGWSPVQPIYPTTNSSTANDVGVFSLSAIESTVFDRRTPRTIALECMLISAVDLNNLGQ